MSHSGLIVKTCTCLADFMKGVSTLSLHQSDVPGSITLMFPNMRKGFRQEPRRGTVTKLCTFSTETAENPAIRRSVVRPLVHITCTFSIVPANAHEQSRLTVLGCTDVDHGSDQNTVTCSFQNAANIVLLQRIQGLLMTNKNQ